MFAYEFKAVPENGMIQIPEEYRKMITAEVTVIVLEKPRKINREGVVNKTDLLPPPSLDTRDFKFNRDEANER